jgi:hypothetical protein
MQKIFQPMAILSFISGGLMIVFSILLGSFRNQPYYYWLDYTSFIQNAIVTIFTLVNLLSLLASTVLFFYIGIKLIIGKRIKIEFIYLAVALSFIPDLLITFLSLIFGGIANAFWVFIEEFIGFSTYATSFFGYFYTFVSAFLSHSIAIVLLVLAIKNRYLLNTLPAGSIFPKKTYSAHLTNSPQGQYRECPFCAETVLAKAKLCKHCRSKI